MAARASAHALRSSEEKGSNRITRPSNLKAERRYSCPVDRATGLICDQTVILSGFYSHKGFLFRSVASSTSR
jgi:hypothetical protein